MAIIDEIKKVCEEFGGTVKGDKDVCSIEVLLAERKVFLSRKKLTYSAKVKINEAEKTVDFSELLKETGFGLSSGGGDMEMSSGFGFKKETYNTFGGARKGTIEEQSKLFGKDYSYKFDYASIRNKIDEIVQKNGYKFVYKII